MKGSPPFKQTKQSLPLRKVKFPGCKGVALVLVLTCLVLITVLTVAFLQAVRTDMSSSKGYADGTKTRMLAESALNVVIGQIQEATQRPNEAWMSQPGLIRTFDTSGNPARAYKLYSSDVLALDGEFNPLASDGSAADVPATWRTDGPNVFADLNKPVIRDGIPFFPIVNPEALQQVEGFSAPDENLTDPSGSVVTREDGTPYKAIPMPVKWLYVLKDGTRSVGVSVPASNGKSVSIAGATIANPPVARIAFWTDDETAKVNINTASEGTYADVPVANTFPGPADWNKKPPASYTPKPEEKIYETDLAYYQPAQKEYQRYGGHPATTSLSPLLYNFIGDALAKPGDRVAILEEIYKISPRYAGGIGSSFSATARPATGSVFNTKVSRLYSSLDELLYSPLFSSNQRVENNLNVEGKRRDLVDKIKFFATASSRAPEVTLFNTPRVAAWPINQADTKRTVSDKLIAFCATVGQSPGRPFYYVRKNPFSPTEDFSLTHPGTSFKNTDVYSYLQDLTGREIPGFGGRFSSKYPQDRDQILTQIFDFIRILNLNDVSGEPIPTGNNDYTYNMAYLGASLAEQSGNPPGVPDRRGLVVPIEPAGGIGAGTKGFGRYYTLSELAVAMIGLFTDSEMASGVVDSSKTKIQVALIPELFNPSPGYPALAINVTLRFEGLNNLTVNGAPVFPGNTHEMQISTMPGKGFLGKDSRFGGQLDPMSLAVTKKLRPEGEAYPMNSPELYPTGEIEVNASYAKQSTLNFSGGNVVVSLLYGTTLVQKGTITIPPSTMTTPSKWGVLLNNPNQGIFEDRQKAQEQRKLDIARSEGIQDDFLRRAKDGVGRLRRGDALVFEPGDWVRSVAPIVCNGDYRMVAGLTSSEDIGKYFGSVPKLEPTTYGTTRVVAGTTFSPRHSLTRGKNAVSDIQGQIVGVLDDTFDYFQESKDNRSGVIPGLIPITRPPGSDPTDALNGDGKRGDWDNSPGLFADGPGINKPDEGVNPGFESNEIPYLGSDWESFRGRFDVQSPTFFSPNRLMPSPVMFGSLPTGIRSGRPWQTLLFRPARSYLPGGTAHAGGSSGGPPDHLMLDLFWNPVVEPYAISEPFSTAGKINLNFQIAPFTYVKRATGLYSVLKSTMITGLDPTAQIASNRSVNNEKFFYKFYKKGLSRQGLSTAPWGVGGENLVIRFPIATDQTVKYFNQRFEQNKPFISASEICEIPLVPKEAGASAGADIPALELALQNFWRDRVKLTGDNMLERPYAFIYPRVTTKSNTYTVHLRVQTLSVSSGSAAAGRFDETRDRVDGEFRGSFGIERYLDTGLDSYDPNRAGGLGPYKMRVISSKQIAL